MMWSRSSIALIFWLVLLCSDVSSFSIRRQPTKTSDLSRALHVLQRQRRRIHDEDYLASSRIPLSSSALGEWDQGIPTREEQAWLQNAYDISPYGDDAFDGDEYLDEAGPMDESDPRDAPVSGTVEASKEELENIFGEKGKDQDSAAQQTDNEVMEKPESVSDEKHEEAEEDDDSDNLTEAEFKALMNAVEKLQKRALVKKETKKSIPNPVSSSGSQPVSKEEMSEVFSESTDEKSGDSAGDVSEETKVIVESTDPASVSGQEEVEETTGDNMKETDDDILNQKYRDTLSSIEKYWQLNDYFNNEKRRKRFTKRAPLTQPPQSVSLEETYMREIQHLKSEIQQLKLMAQLEDMENDALTQTLNEATLSQMAGTVSQKEFGSLEQAIKLEEALQDLKNGKVDPLIVELIAADAVGDLDKRGEPLWKKKEKRMDEADLEESYPMFNPEKRDDYLVMPSEKRSSKRVEEKDVERWYDSPVREGKEDEDDSFMNAQEAVDAMVRNLAASDLSEDENDDVNEDENAVLGNDDVEDSKLIPYTPSVSTSGQCPSAPLITDCGFADSQGLPIDDEARELCNRHELCYECGATSGIDQSECDNLYRGDAAILCDKSADCVIEAELFLQEMKLKHRYSTYYRPTCDNPCTVDYIGL